jgi:hypothetical protein
MGKRKADMKECCEGERNKLKKKVIWVKKDGKKGKRKKTKGKITKERRKDRKKKYKDWEEGRKGEMNT